MKAIILAAGDGTRLLPLTSITPKPLLEVLGKPILEHIVMNLPSEITEVYIVIDQKNEQLFDIFLRTHTFAFPVYLVFQDKKHLGTWGALSVCKEYIKDGESFLVQNGDDIFSSSDIADFVQQKAPVCGLYKKRIEARYRTCDLDPFNKKIKGLRHQNEEELQSEAWVVTGLYILPQSIFSLSPELHNNEESLPDTLFAQYQNISYMEMNMWLSINTLSEYQYAKEFLMSQNSYQDGIYVKSSE